MKSETEKIHKNLLKKVESNKHRNVVSFTGQFYRTWIIEDKN